MTLHFKSTNDPDLEDIHLYSTKKASEYSKTTTLRMQLFYRIVRHEKNVILF